MGVPLAILRAHGAETWVSCGGYTAFRLLTVSYSGVVPERDGGYGASVVSTALANAVAWLLASGSSGPMIPKTIVSVPRWTTNPPLATLMLGSAAPPGPKALVWRDRVTLVLPDQCLRPR